MTAVGTLYLVSTPIGNLSDMTLRAIETLRESDVVLAEDTRRTRVLLEHHGIHPRDLRSYHKHNEAARGEEVRQSLSAGQRVALVSDSGTPVLSDPGLRLVELAIDMEARVVPIPGASSVLAALVASGMAAEPFTFIGFPPRSGLKRQTLIDTLAFLPHTAVLFESPHRLVATLEDLSVALSPERRVAVARELTKLHEEIYRGTLAEALAYYRESPPRGEVVLCLAGSGGPEASDEEVARQIASSLAEEGATAKEIVRALQERCGIERNRAYSIALGARHELEE